MVEVKVVLKQAKKLLGECRSQDELLDDNIEDYMLFCFAALACANLDDVTRAKVLYEKAILLDSKMPIAWQGLYKLYSSGKLAPEDRSIEVCTRLAALRLFYMTTTIKYCFRNTEGLTDVTFNSKDGSFIKRLGCVSMHCLSLFRENDISSALDIVDGSTDSLLTFLPLSMISVHLLAEVENWERVIQASVFSLFFINSAISCYETYLVSSFWVNTLDFLFLYSSSYFSHLSVLHAINGGSPENALEDAESILNDELASWHDFILVAELNMALSKDAMSLLVKSAKMNPRSSRVFFLLGKALCRKNPLKARSCLERAVKIRPTNEEYVRALDDVYCEAGESVEQRLSLLNGLFITLVHSLSSNGYASNTHWDTVISELQHVVRELTDDIVSWAGLAEAYSSRGNLQLIQVLMRMHNLDAAAERCARWRSCHGQDSALKNAVDLLDAQVRLRLFDSTLSDKRYNYLKTAFNLLDSVISEKPRISLAYKLAADALFRNKYPSWSVSCRLSAIRSSIIFYSVALHLNQGNPWAWNDLAVALLYSAHLNNSSEDAVKALECLRKALSLCKCFQMRSHFWTLIAEAERLSAIEGERNDAPLSAALQQHYLVRALQLNKANDEAWLRLALLYYTNGMDQSHMAIETALKHNPQLAEAWCAWALKADSEGIIHEAMDMFRHSISIKPIVSDFVV
uniref:TPR_REGION domain-containing protein n=1 Tax=Angiostrongylus cantonensis TaxID=6313 RepID=A0A158PBC5_ANGCA